MTARPPPERHWRAYGTEPLPPAQEALQRAGAGPACAELTAEGRRSRRGLHDFAHGDGGLHGPVAARSWPIVLALKVTRLASTCICKRQPRSLSSGLCLS